MTCNARRVCVSACVSFLHTKKKEKKVKLFLKAFYFSQALLFVKIGEVLTPVFMTGGLGTEVSPVPVSYCSFSVPQFSKTL